MGLRLLFGSGETSESADPLLIRFQSEFNLYLIHSSVNLFLKSAHINTGNNLFIYVNSYHY